MGGGSWDHQSQDEFGNNGHVGHPVGGSWGDPHLGHQGAAPPPPPYEDFALCVVDQGGGSMVNVNTAQPTTTTTAVGQYGMSKMEHLPLIAQVHEVSLSQLIRQLVLSVLILKYVLISAT